MNIQKIFENNKKWVSERLKADTKFFENLSKGQHPDFLYIGCSDSRVTVEDMMGMQPGEVFVHRNIANVVSNYDLNTLSVINYAVEHLKVKHIIVCGHYGCGGVKAAMDTTDLGILNPHLRNIKDVYRLHKEELNSIQDDDKKYKRLVELNVQEQCLNVLEKSFVQKAYRAGSLEVHGWVFDIKSGHLVDLQIDIDDATQGLTDIYIIN